MPAPVSPAPDLRGSRARELQSPAGHAVLCIFGRGRGPRSPQATRRASIPGRRCRSLHIPAWPWAALAAGRPASFNPAAAMPFLAYPAAWGEWVGLVRSRESQSRAGDAVLCIFGRGGGGPVRDWRAGELETSAPCRVAEPHAATIRSIAPRRASNRAARRTRRRLLSRPFSSLEIVVWSTPLSRSSCRCE